MQIGKMLFVSGGVNQLLNHNKNIKNKLLNEDIKKRNLLLT